MQPLTLMIAIHFFFLQLDGAKSYKLYTVKVKNKDCDYGLSFKSSTLP